MPSLGHSFEASSLLPLTRQKRRIVFEPQWPVGLVLLICAVENVSKGDQQFQVATDHIRQTGGIA